MIIGGDYNTEFKNSSPFDSLWAEFVTKHDLMNCDEFIGNGNSYTYCHDSLGQTKWNDHFIISKSIATSTNNHMILDVGDNTSDHNPIMFSMSITLPTQLPQPEASIKSPSLKWDKCSEEQKQLYSDSVRSFLQDSPSTLTMCHVPHCTNDSCTESIQTEFDNLTSIVKEADKVLPRHKPGVQKHWWSEELSLLKEKSIENHRLWRQKVSQNQVLPMQSGFELRPIIKGQ